MVNTKPKGHYWRCVGVEVGSHYATYRCANCRKEIKVHTLYPYAGRIGQNYIITAYGECEPVIEGEVVK